ncbi:MAG: acetoacetate decarboxylase family protein [Smithellaceae bacterium]|jgi:hypothetical protein
MKTLKLLEYSKFLRHRYLETFVRLILIGHGLIFLFLVIGCASLMEKRYTYHEFDGLFVYYKTQDLSTYRELLPQVFDMPGEPLVMTFVMDYYKMDRATEPYKEVAVFLLAKYKQRLGWHCVTMPVTSDEARIGGITYLGYPKIMGDIRFQRDPLTYTGMLMLNNKIIMTVKFDPRKNNKASKSEEEWFDKLPKLTSFNLLNGEVYEPEFGRKTNLLEASRLYPDKLIVKTGSVNLTQDPEAAGTYSAHLAKVFSIKPSEIVLAYYLKNSLTQTFGSGKFTDR